jgi:RimJ/RimL family protein N-acetyltransferase
MLLRVQQWADEQKLPVVLQVMKHNDAARRLYERLGFIALGEDERDYHLWRPFTSAETLSAPTREHKTPDRARSPYEIRLTEWFRRLFFRSEA